MRVLLLSWEHPPVVVGGLGRHVQELAKALAGLGHEVVVLSRGPMGATAAQSPLATTTQDGVRVVSVPEDPLSLEFGSDLVAWTLSFGHAMLRAGLALAESFQPEVVHAHDWLVAAPAIALAEHLAVPLVTTVHATEAGRHDGWIGNPVSAQVHSAERWLAHGSDALICCSESMCRETTTLFEPLDEPVAVIPNGIDLSIWPFRPPDRCATPPRLLFVGRLEYEKGVHDLVAALPAIRTAHPGTTLSVVGTGTQEQWLREIAREHKVASAVRFFGKLDRNGIQRHMRASSAMVVPSRYEPFGLVALEGAAAGVPLVVADTGGLGEAVAENVNGRTFPPGEVAALAEAVGRSLASPARSARMAKAARDRIADGFDWRSVAERTVEVYRGAKRHDSREPTPRPSLKLPVRLLQP
ncbi:MAG: glycosyltransferase family 4 protein [Segniliparus sp.]|uniref:glycosyltransferase family 4 protein n=1 Tax=Segniliparus sp. TaxID=2804064 RepID=UPI003F2EE744